MPRRGEAVCETREQRQSAAFCRRGFLFCNQSKALIDLGGSACSRDQPCELFQEIRPIGVGSFQPAVLALHESLQECPTIGSHTGQYSQPLPSIGNPALRELTQCPDFRGLAKVC